MQQAAAIATDPRRPVVLPTSPAPPARTDREVVDLIRSVEGVVRTIARHFGRGLDRDALDDLKAAGRMGAFVAARKYEEGRGATFCTYATYWVRAHVVSQAFFFWGRGRFNKHLSPKIKRVFFRYGRACRALETDGSPPSLERVAELLDVPEEALKDILAVIATSDESIHEYEGDRVSDRPRSLEERLTDVLVADPLDDLCARADLDDLREALETLSVRERRVIEGHYFRGRLLREVGEEMGVTCSRAQQIEAGALRKMRDHLAER